VSSQNANKSQVASAPIEEPVAEVDPRYQPGGSLDTTKAPRLWTEDELASMDSIDDLKRMVAEKGVTTASITSFGNGYAVLEDKAVLVKRHFYIVDWRFNTGDMGEFVTMQVLAETTEGTTEKLIVNDGSTGIRDQLHRIQNANGGQTCVLDVPRGLVKSDYKTFIPDGKSGEKEISATTYYLSTAR